LPQPKHTTYVPVREAASLLRVPRRMVTGKLQRLCLQPKTPSINLPSIHPPQEHISWSTASRSCAVFSPRACSHFREGPRPFWRLSQLPVPNRGKSIRRRSAMWVLAEMTGGNLPGRQRSMVITQARIRAAWIRGSDSASLGKFSEQHSAIVQRSLGSPVVTLSELAVPLFSRGR
jgi:hypothetical protein